MKDCQGQHVDSVLRWGLLAAVAHSVVTLYKIIFSITKCPPGYSSLFGGAELSLELILAVA